jgi:outer membrane lipoprotein-sorting protein
MQKYIISIALLINSIFAVYAQKVSEAETLINSFSNTVKTSAIRTSFTLKVSEKNAVNSQSVSGTFLLKGNQFYLEIDGMKVWFNGKTQWAMTEESNEVAITEPTEEELAQTNPVAIISGFRKVSIIRSGKSTGNLQSVEMLPKDKKQDFQIVRIQFDKSTGNLVSVFIQYKKGMTNLLTITRYQKNITVAADAFTFDKNKFKNVLINDLR